MCGIAGFWKPACDRSNEDLCAAAAAMAETLARRGPDDAGCWADERAGVAFGHRRLSVIDPSAAGHQPMRSESGRYTIVYNGEVYNHPGLRRELERAGHAFRGSSDTEVMLAAVEEWGFESALDRFHGMFAFALWDAERRDLLLARDRLGIKPLYYGFVGSAFVFASEPQAFRRVDGWTGEIDPASLALFMRHACVPAPHSIYRGIRKLEPGRLCIVRDPSRPFDGIETRTWWSARTELERAQSDLYEGAVDDAATELERLLSASVRERLIADVPLGAFLSGGIDSSLVTALMQKESCGRVKTFTIAFDDERLDESAHARAVAEHLGTDHTEFAVTAAEARAVVPELPTVYAEPFADSSQIPTLLLSRLTRGAVTVALSGDGGDELFGGYPRYALARTLWKRIGWMPRPARALVGRLLMMVPLPLWEPVFKGLRPVLPGLFRHRSPGDVISRFAEMIAVKNSDEVYPPLMTQWSSASPVQEGDAPALLQDLLKQTSLNDFTRRMMFLDVASYLPDDILVKVDRASMSCGLEVRVPLLDHRVFAFAARLSLSHLMGKHGGKRALRRVLYRHVPREIVDRPKKGFGVPLAEWLRGDLRDWAEALLARHRLRTEGYLDADRVRQRWKEHLAGTADWKYDLWNVLMFQAWLENAGNRQQAIGNRQ